MDRFDSLSFLCWTICISDVSVLYVEEVCGMKKEIVVMGGRCSREQGKTTGQLGWSKGNPRQRER